MSTDYKFEGWAAFGPDSVKGNFKRHEFEPKPFEETDVDIAIQYCGICASDVHTASGGWAGPNQVYPEIVGHEIVGKAVRVGSKVSHVKVGDIVGVGAQCDSCGDCRECNMHKEPRCPENVGTYGGSWKKGVSAGVKSWGGYADYGRYPGAFVVKIPDGVDPAMAAPMLCGGGTLYNPLKAYGAGPGVDVGIIGIGGLGHFGLLFAKALGANVTAISHSERKEEDAKKMGADRFIATHSGKEDDFKPYARSLDLIICTTNDAKMPIDGYLSLLRPDGRLVLVGAPEEKLPQISAFTFIVGGVFLGGSMIASPKELNEMLELAKDKKVDAWIKKWDMNDVNKAVPDMVAGNARYRHVLVNTKNGGVL